MPEEPKSEAGREWEKWEKEQAQKGDNEALNYEHVLRRPWGEPKIGQLQSTKPEKFIFYISILSQMRLLISSNHGEVIYGND